MSHAALFIACQMPERSGLPSAVRGRPGDDWPPATSATEAQMIAASPDAIPRAINRLFILRASIGVSLQSKVDSIRPRRVRARIGAFRRTNRDHAVGCACHASTGSDIVVPNALVP